MWMDLCTDKGHSHSLLSPSLKEINKEQDGGPCQLRHTSSWTYKVWREHRSSFITIPGCFCTFKSGASVVGCYAHIASVLWYGGCKWHQPATKSSQARDIQVYMGSLIDAAAEVWKSIKV